MLVTQSCPTLCNLIDCSPPGSSVHEIFQARILEWVAISFSRVSSHLRDRTCVSCTAGRFFTYSWGKILHLLWGKPGLITKSCPTLATSWATARWDPLCMGFSRQEYCSGLPFPTPGYLPNLGIKLPFPESPVFQVVWIAWGFFTAEPLGKPAYF